MQQGDPVARNATNDRKPSGKRPIERNRSIGKNLQVNDSEPTRRHATFWSPHFLLAVILLAIAAILAGPVSAWRDLRQMKEPLPLKRPLSTMREYRLAPYEVVGKQVLEPAMVEALDTDQYIYWELRDTSLPPEDPLATAVLFVTYYTGGSSLVPHTPDVCFVGAGYNPAQPHENKSIEVPTLTPGARELPVRVCTFARTAIFNQEKTTVLYTFHTNGEFVATRTDVRLRTHNPLDTHAYFSKVEIGFPRATRAQAIDGADKLLARVLPVLLEDHYPDFEAAERAAREGA